MRQDNLDSLLTKPVGRLLWDYSIPAVVGMVVMAIYSIVDRMFVGHVVGPEAIAGLTITFPVMNVSTAIGVLVGVGASARSSIMLGNGDIQSAERVLGNTVTLTLVNAVIFLSLLAIFIDDVLIAFGASEATLPYAREFMQYIIPGMLMMNITFSLNNVMRASGYPTKAMVTMLISAGLNIILAPVFIYFLDLGIKGAAMATDISIFISMIFVLKHFFEKKSTLHFKSGIYALKWHIITGVVAIGAAPSIVNVASCLINVIINTTLYSYGGDNAVAAAGIFTTYASMLVAVIIGICQGMQPIIGYNYGANHYHRMLKAFWLAVGAATLVSALGWIVGLSMPEYIAKTFTDDAELIGVTSNALSISMICFAAVGFQIVATTFFQSIGKAGKSIFLGLTRQVLFLIPLLFIMRDLYGLNGIWAAFPSSDFFATIVTTILIFSQIHKLKAAERNHKQPQQTETSLN